MVNSFQLTRLPELIFGAGSMDTLPQVILRFGHKVLIITGSQSFHKAPKGEQFFSALRNEGITFKIEKVGTEPSPAIINKIVNQHMSYQPNLVIAIGGGSVLDAGKAVSAMLPSGMDVSLFLEGVGTQQHDGKKIPFIAVPTTAGTGSEATKNAVLSEVGVNGFKRSLRHDQFIPEVAVLDPALSIGCPPEITLSSGLDALTQLMEAYLSTKSNPFTDALALPAIKSLVEMLPKAYQDGENLAARAEMAYAAYISGICLANAGLGLVHGFASVIGSRVRIPHGYVCASLLKSCHSATYMIIKQEGKKTSFLLKYKSLAGLFAEHSGIPGAVDFSEALDTWMSQLPVPRLSMYEIQDEDLEYFAQQADLKNNPAAFSMEDLKNILEKCM